jgi:hypothetical protein
LHCCPVVRSHPAYGNADSPAVLCRHLSVCVFHFTVLLKL